MLERTSLLVTLAFWGCANSNGTMMEGVGGSSATGGTSGSAGANGIGGSATGGERANEAGAGGSTRGARQATSNDELGLLAEHMRARRTSCAC
jgi:hypothetical protein